MKILYITSAFLPESFGGTELHAWEVGRTVKRRHGHDVLFFTRTGDASRPDYDVTYDTYDDLDVCRVNYNFGDARSFEDIYKNAKIDALFAAELERFAPDVVHVHHVTCLSTGIMDVCKDRGVPLVMTLHDFWMVCPRGQRMDPLLELCDTVDRVKCHWCLGQLWPHFFPEAPAGPPSAVRGAVLRDAPERLADWDAHTLRVLGRADVLLAPSAFHRDRLLEFGLPEDRLEALPHGLDHDRLREERDPHGPIQAIAFLGTVIPSKGVHVLVEAFNLLYRPELKLNVFGDAPSYHGETGYIEKMRSTLKPDIDVEFHGRYDPMALPLIMKGVDVLVVPSVWWESFCLTIREGLLGGCIVVAADHGAMAEALDGGRNGVLFEPGSPQDLCLKLEDLLAHPERWPELRNLGHRVKTLDQNVLEILDRYRVAMARAGRPVPANVTTETTPDVVANDDADSSPGSDAPKVTVFIPTYNGGMLFDEVLRRIFVQQVDFDFEVLCIDSGSTDETLDIIAKYPVRLIRIPNSEFNHGLTRNRGVREARGEIVVLLTQDAVPFDDEWLAALVSNYDDPQVAGAYCHQIPRENCNPFQRDRLVGWTKGEGEPEVKFIEDRMAYEALQPMEKYRIIAFDDVASSVRKSVMATIPFAKRQFGEDVEWARRAVLAGHKTVMEPRAVVVHSHDNSIWYEFKRVYLDHQNLNDLVGMHLVPRFRDALRFTLDGTRHLGGVIRRSDLSLLRKFSWWVRTPFYSLGQNLGQYLGARSSIEKKRGWLGALDRVLKKGV